jgi:hypothetical protein
VLLRGMGKGGLDWMVGFDALMEEACGDVFERYILSIRYNTILDILQHGVCWSTVDSMMVQFSHMMMSRNYALASRKTYSPHREGFQGCSRSVSITEEPQERRP